MKSIIGTFRTKKSSEHGSYQYLSLHPFPNDEFHDALTKKHFSKANTAQFLLGELSGVTRFLPDVDFFLTSFIMKDAESSAQIEGTRASIADALEYSIDPQANKQTDADDILHYVEALKYGIKRLKEDDFPFSLRFIRELHDVLMQDARATQFADP